MKSIVLDLDKPQTVTFDFGVLAAVENATGKNLNEIFAGELPAYFVPGVTKSQDLTDAQRQELARRWNIGFMARFVAACLGTEVVHLHTIVPVHRLVGVFYQLLDPFYAAVRAFNSGEEQPGPPPASTASGLGPVSSSDSTQSD